MVEIVIGKTSTKTARRLHTAVASLMLGALITTSAGAAFAQATGSPASAAKKGESDRAGVEVPPEYVIGPEDVLGINFWREAEMTGDVTVRPDGRVTLPLLGDIEAAGLSPTQLADRILQAAKKLIADPTVTVLVRTINSRKVYITGQVANPGAYPLTGPRTVMQAIALAGGLTEYADRKNITISRTDHGKPVALKFNYNDVARGKNLAQNIALKPGDTVVVP
jgi:polysaccharide export outer membrane protein